MDRRTVDRSPTAEGVLRGIVRPDGRGQRSDATRNRDRVVGAALEIFAENGMMGTVEQIAERAGVGRATVYRNFPTRDALQVMVATSQFEQIHEVARQAAKHTDPPGICLVEFVFAAFEYNQANRLYLELYNGRPTEEMLAVHTASRRTISDLTEAARQGGVIRREIRDYDVALFVGGLSVRLAGDRSSTREDWRRAATLALTAFGVPADLLPPRRIPSAHREG